MVLGQDLQQWYQRDPKGTRLWAEPHWARTHGQDTSVKTSTKCKSGVFLLSGPVYSCAAYAAVYAMPTRPQWEPTWLIPLKKVCLCRPNARVKRRHNVRFCLRRHTSVCFWKVGNGTFAYATSPIHISAKWDALRHPALPAAARAPRLQSAHRHLAATPMCSSLTSNQVPKRTLNIWWINHDKSLKTQLVTFDYAGVKPSDVFDCR